MMDDVFDLMEKQISQPPQSYPMGIVQEVAGGRLLVGGLRGRAAVGDVAQVLGSSLTGEVVKSSKENVVVILDGSSDGVCPGQRVMCRAKPDFAPHTGWIGRVIDPDGQPLDGWPLLPGRDVLPLTAPPPCAGQRRELGERLPTKMAVFDTLLPIVRGQRVGLFAGSGVGKSTLLGNFARHMAADVIVIGLVGERGRELREFTESVLGPDGMARSIVVAATSDRAPQVRRRCALAATTIAEYFRDQGLHVLLLLDSVTRFAEAHREVSAAIGEPSNLRGFPASTPAAIAGLCERAGPGAGNTGDITAIYTVLVAGSDMEEPVADMLRGVLDGHVVLDRAIAERGRYPAVDVTRSVSRSLPAAASPAENTHLQKARQILGTYAQAELMIQSGLYVAGSDAKIDEAIATFDALEAFISTSDSRSIATSFHLLQKALSVQGQV